MRRESCRVELVRLLAEMPFLDRQEMSAVSGRSSASVHETINRLERDGMVSSFSHGSETISSTARYCLTEAGLHALADRWCMAPDRLVREYPVSAQWMRILLERIDSVAVIYRLASTISAVVRPLGVTWYRSMPVDAAIRLPDARTIAVVRQGPTGGRTSFFKRLWRLRNRVQTGAVLALVPDEVRMRDARGRLSGLPMPAYLALERQAADAAPDDAVWRAASISSTSDLVSVLSGIRPSGAIPEEPPQARAELPKDIKPRRGLVEVSKRTMLALLSPAEKRVLGLLHDWPWISRVDLAGILGVSQPRTSQLLARLAAHGMATATGAGGHLLAPTDEGLALLARRDRTSVGMARKRWSAAILDERAPFAWRNVRGSRSRQLLRNLEHSQAVHGFVAALAKQARATGWELQQLDPPPRASRYFRHGDTVRSIHPDAFGILRRGPNTRPFFLEWERRAIRPGTMAARLAPYLRYYSTHRPIDDHGVRPSVLIVLRDDVAATQFLRVARGEMDRTGVEVPLSVSHEAALEDLGPLGMAWRNTGKESRQVRGGP